MALIETRWLTHKSENAISLAGETWLRRLPFGRSWTKIRFGCLATLQGGFIEQTTAATAIGDLKFLLGISSSDAWDTGMLSAQSGVGVSVTGTPVIGTAAGLAAASAFPTQCWIGGASPFAFTFRTEGHEGLGQVRTATTFAGTAAYIYPDGNTDGAKRRGIYVVDITRNQGGSGSCTVDFYYVISGGAGGTTLGTG